jgi:cytochrome P450
MSPTKPKADADNPTIFESILSRDLPASEKTSERLVGEAESVVGAGALTVAHYLTTTIYHILANPAIVKKLQEEMKMVMPDPNILPPAHELNQLSYFNAVILEGYRISHGVTSRLTRIAPNESLQVAGFKIPAGIPINMSSFLSHLNPELFPQPKVFQPERWLEPGAENLKKYIVNFSRGGDCVYASVGGGKVEYGVV